MRTALALLTCIISASPAFASDVVNIYSFRQPFLIQPILTDFIKQTGIKRMWFLQKKG
jgi:iron(III) transport system substrate-binding protein